MLRTVFRSRKLASHSKVFYRLECRNNNFLSSSTHVNILTSNQTNARNHTGQCPYSSASIQFRYFSSFTSDNDKQTSDSTTYIDSASYDSTTPSVEESLDKLFQNSQQQLVDAASTVSEHADSALASWTPTWYNVADQAVVLLKEFHDLTGVDYGWAIVGVTILLRIALFPVMVHAQRTSSRMMHIQPEMTVLKSKYAANESPTRQDQILFSKQMKALFKKYNVNPFAGFLLPVIQLPIFMGMFFGLKKMPALYPDEFSTQGMLWFTDLTVPDPLYILPVLSAVTFLGMVEVNKENTMASGGPNGQSMINFMRFMSVAMIPISIQFDASMLCYWTANNTFTFAQTALLTQPKVRKYFDIWDKPKPIPGTEPQSMKDAAMNLLDGLRGQKKLSGKEKIKRHNLEIETKKKAKAFSLLREARRRDKMKIRSQD